MSIRGNDVEKSNGMVLTVKNLTKRYPAPYTTQIGSPTNNKKQSKGHHVVALDSVNFSLKAGIYGLLGPNGAGKTTLIHIITGSLRQDKGQVLWNGKNIRKLNRKYRSILGFMPQQQNLYNSFTGFMFLDYIAALKAIPKKIATQEIEQVAASVHLTNDLEKRLSAYSGGMKQRLLVASSLLGDPQLLVMDEPTAGLDPKERVELRDMLHSFSQDKIVFVATHVVPDIETIADEIILLKKGHVADIGSPGTLIEKYCSGANLEQVYLNVFGSDI